MHTGSLLLTLSFLLILFLSPFRLSRIAPTEDPVKHNVVHRIETAGPPTSTRTRRLAPHRLKVARAEFEHMLELGIIQPSSSCWSSALHLQCSSKTNTG